MLAESLKPDDITKRAGKSRASYYRTAGFVGTPSDTNTSRRAVLDRAFARALGGAADDLDFVVALKGVGRDVVEEHGRLVRVAH